MTLSYKEKLKDPRWQKKRLEILQRDQWVCKRCGNDKLMLQVHHRYYCNGSDPWEYPNDALLTLCRDCHEIVEVADDEPLGLVLFSEEVMPELSLSFIVDRSIDFDLESGKPLGTALSMLCRRVALSNDGVGIDIQQIFGFFEPPQNKHVA
jgi:ribosomal protein S27AE